jgi:hypothetical protein
VTITFVECRERAEVRGGHSANVGETKSEKKNGICNFECLSLHIAVACARLVKSVLPCSVTGLPFRLSYNPNFRLLSSHSCFSDVASFSDAHA